MRLTKYDKKLQNYFYNGAIDYDEAEMELELCNKLGQLEDIEQELGIDLIAFIKCLTLLDQNKFRFVRLNEKAKIIEEAITPFEFYIDMTEKVFVQSNRATGYKIKLYFKDYGKTWALTKEELL